MPPILFGFCAAKRQAASGVTAASPFGRFCTRSVMDYKRKMRRGSGHSQYLRANKRLGLSNRGWKYFRFVNTSSTATCTEGRDAWQRCCSSAVAAEADEEQQ